MGLVAKRSMATRHAKAAEAEEDSRLNCRVNSRDMYRVGQARA
jgi:hypothetical protein